MDADILRKQLRKTLVSNKKLGEIDDDDHEEEDVSNGLEHDGMDDEDDEEESYLRSAHNDDDDDDDDGGNIKGLIDDDDDDDDEDSAGDMLHHRFNDYGDDDDDEEQKGKVTEDDDDDNDVGVDDESRVLGDPDDNGEDGGESLNHVSVLEAWSKQIEQTVGQLKARGSENEFIEGLKVEYIESQARHPGSPLTTQFASPKQKERHHSSSQDDEFQPGANSKEDLENLGRIFLRIKMEACKWLEKAVQNDKLFIDPDSGTKRDPTDTANIFEVLKNGVALCEAANALVPHCIPNFTSDFSQDTSFMIPLSERENIKKFIKACHDSMNIPDSLLFQVGDLHNMQNMPKVILSLRAIAEYARLYLGSTPLLHWPRIQDSELGFSDDDDAVLLASAEMSKMDVQTVHHMYAVDTKPAGKSRSNSRQRQSSMEKVGFSERKRSIQQNLVMSTLNKNRLNQMENTSSSAVKARGGGKDEDGHGKRRSKEDADSEEDVDNKNDDDDDDDDDDEDYDDDGNENSGGGPSVQSWLESLGMGSYYKQFVADGWDEMETVVLMTEGDLDDVGIKKKGHKRKLVNALRELQNAGREDDHDGMDSGPGSPTRGGRFGSRRYSVEKREIFNKDVSWSQWRAKSSVTLDVEDAKAIWAMLSELKFKVGEPSYLSHFPLDTSRSVGHLVSMAEDIVRSLMPFDAPIVLDIGWHSVKCGFVFNKRPIEFPTIVGKYSVVGSSSSSSSSSSSFNNVSATSAGKNSDGVASTVSGSNPSSRRSGAGGGAPHVYTSGRHVYEQCHAAMNASSLSTASEIGSFVVRRVFHRGIDSIKDPVVIEWEDLEKLVEHVYRDVLHTYSDRHPVMIVEPVKGWGAAERTRLTEMLLKKFQVPQICFSPAAPLVSFHASCKNCVVVDLGESRSTASVIYNHRLVKDAVVNTPIGGLQLTELMMQNLTQEGFELKTIYEAKNPNKFGPLRHFMEQEVSKEIKDQTCIVSSAQDEPVEEKCVNSDSLPAHLVDYLPRVTRGTTYINVGDVRQQVGEAIFTPGVIRRDQFYNGGSIHQVIKEALSRCTDVVNTAASETVLLCGGMSKIPGLVERLQMELDELYSSESRKSPRVLLATDAAEAIARATSAAIGPLNSVASRNSRSDKRSKRSSGKSKRGERKVKKDPAFSAWLGASKVVMEHAFQTRWIVRQDYVEKGEKALQESPVWEGLGPFPLHSPDTALYKANRAVAALGDLVSTLHQHGADPNTTSSPPSASSVARDGSPKVSSHGHRSSSRHRHGSSSSSSRHKTEKSRRPSTTSTTSSSSSSTSSSRHRRSNSSGAGDKSSSRPRSISTQSSTGKSLKAKSSSSPSTPTGRSSATAKAVASLEADPLSPRSLKDLIHEVAAFLDSKHCPERHILDVKMYLYQLYANRPPQRRMGALETIQTLPDRLLSILTPYIGGGSPSSSGAAKKDISSRSHRSSRRRSNSPSSSGSGRSSRSHSSGSRGSRESSSRKAGLPSPPLVDDVFKTRPGLFSDDDDEEDDEEGEDVWAMAI